MSQEINMIHKLYLKDVRPFSINGAYYTKTMNMTRECRAWRQTVFKALRTRQNLETMEKIRTNFIPKKHGISVSYSFGIPEWAFFKKDGDISIKSLDLSNVEKLLQDILFDRRFFERKELANLNLDDKLVLKLSSEKIPTIDTWAICVRIKLIDLPRRSNESRSQNTSKD